MLNVTRRLRKLTVLGLTLGALVLLAGCSGKTTGASSITTDSALLNAVGSCDNPDCSAFMRWRKVGTTPWTKGPTINGIGKVDKVSWHRTATGLTPGTQYEYQECGREPSFADFVCVGPDSSPATTQKFTTADWSIVPSANAVGPQGHFGRPGSSYSSNFEVVASSTVSCSGATACTAVGSYLNRAGTEVTLAERWDGTTWAIQPTPNPTDAQASELSGISCPSATACTAVGSNTNRAGTEVMLAERWNGTTWASQPIPKPTGARGSSLSGVSCTSATACTAVGSYKSNGERLTLAAHWNGTSWTIKSTPNPTGARDSELSGISCTSATACTAVGHYHNISTGTAATLAERWNGTSWAIQPTPNSATGGWSGLSGVSCTSATACTAIGLDATYDVTLAERWNGTTWARQPIPKPTGAQASGLSGISCTSATACTAVGAYINGNYEKLTLAARWNGSSWTIESTPNPTGAQGSELSGISCTSATACTAVGGSHSARVPAEPPRTASGTEVTLAERWNGTTWAIQPTPTPSEAPKDTSLEEISCTSATACTAVGSGTGQALAERWNGTAWAIQPIPKPTGAQRSSLSGVSCASATACTAVGSYINSNGDKLTLAARWNGTSWAIESTPNPTGAQGSELSGVSCPSATACTAVGGSRSAGTEVTVAERWNGTTWAIQPTPDPTGAQGSSLSGVSCTSASACTAVGNGSGSLAERWNGTTWAIQRIPEPSDATGSFLQGVSCTSATACTAVGIEFNAATWVTQALAAHWNGTSWTIESTPNLTGAQGSELSGISCTSATTCTAVGSGPRAVQWDGTTWAAQTMPTAAGAQNSRISGVSCTSVTDCTAVGDYQASVGGHNLTLVEAGFVGSS